MVFYACCFLSAINMKEEEREKEREKNVTNRSSVTSSLHSLFIEHNNRIVEREAERKEGQNRDS